MRSRIRQHTGWWVVSIVVIGTITGAGVGPTAGEGAMVTETPAAAPPSIDTERAALAAEPRPTASPPEPDHGVNTTAFPRLWSGDIDEPAAEHNGTFQHAILAAVDYPFGRPPEAVETWNAGDHQEFPRTDANTSVYPPHVNLTDEDWIKDAYIQLFAIQPSTITHVAAADTRHYIRPSGKVLGTTDYRIDFLPEERHDYNPPSPAPGETVLVEEVVTRRLVNHEMSNITLRADGDPVAVTGPTHTPRFAYTGLPQSTERLSLSVTISATLKQTTRRKYRAAHKDCETRPVAGNNTTTVTECVVDYTTFWTTEVDYLNRETTVRDTTTVDIYDLSPMATRATFTDGRRALAVNRSTGDPWAAYTTAQGTVHNLWHFYSTRNQHWDTLVVSTKSGTTHRSSNAIPLHVHAFPSAGGAYTRSGFGGLEVTETWGSDRSAPVLPDPITVPVVSGTYRQRSVVVAQSDGEIAPDGRVTVSGLVRGTETTTTVSRTRRQRATTLDVTLLDVNRSAGTVTVRVSLHEAATAQPIGLRSRPGVIVVHGVTVEPGASGTAVVTVPLASGLVTATYKPGAWWTTDPVYAPARATAGLPTAWPTPIRLLTTGVTLLAWLSPLLLAIYLLDRLLTKGRLWPPWRNG